MDSTFGGLEAIITGLCDEYPNVLKRHRELFVAGLVAVIYILSLPTTTYVRDNTCILLIFWYTNKLLFLS